MRKKLLEEPLVHFLILGFVLLAGFRLLGLGEGAGPVGVDLAGERGIDFAAAESSKTIRIESQALAAFVQERTGLLDAAEFAEVWNGLSANAREDWRQRFVREEALVREARRLGLDREDPLIRRRLVQQMEFLATGAIERDPQPTDETLEAFHAKRRADYRIPARLRFSHVFIRPGEDAGGPAERSQARAAELLRELNAREASDEEAFGEGHRFLYQRVYADRTLEEVESHFGTRFGAAIMQLEPDPRVWQGPLRSDHGWHLVRLQRKEAERFPSLAEVRTAVVSDWRRARHEEVLDAAVEEIVSGYRVEGPEP